MLSFRPRETNNATAEPDEEDENTKLYINEKDVLATALVTGHLGATPAAVSGSLRVIIDPQFAIAHAFITSKPHIQISFRGAVRTLPGAAKANSLLRHNILFSHPLFHKEKILINESLSFPESLTIGLRSDDDGVAILIPGTYDVPFRFNLPSVLPPSFHDWNGRVSYKLTAFLKFKEKKRFLETTFSKNIKQYINLKRFNAEHIITPSNSMLPSISITESATQTPETSHLSISNMGRSMSAVSSRAATSNFNPASLIPPLAVTSEGGVVHSPLRAKSLNNIEVDDFTMPATFSNLEIFPTAKSNTTTAAADILRYYIVMPTRSFGPDDEITVNIHVSKVPDGLQVHHVEVSLSVEITTRTVQGGQKTRMRTLLSHRDYPESSGHYWNRKVVLDTKKLFQPQTLTPVPESISDVAVRANPVSIGANTVSVGADSATAEGPMPYNNEDELRLQTYMTVSSIGGLSEFSFQESEVDNAEQPNPQSLEAAPPPAFDDIHHEFLVSNNSRRSFQSTSSNQRTALLEALMSSNDIQSALLSNSQSVQDSGIALGSSSVFHPWTNVGAITSAPAINTSNNLHPPALNPRLTRRANSGISEKNKSKKSMTNVLNSFTSPFISTRHKLRIRIACHKPMPAPIPGSQLLLRASYEAPDSTNLSSSSSSIYEDKTRLIDWGKALNKMVPVGFESITEVEAAVVLHAASEKDRKFLMGYFYGPE
ncbi:hypothetical protein HK100_010351 [Physocladia obscura]|uniref:Arrestin-like N-terminal domain-containing protein n=1 Tax=Physocladia obscura TaxID=109957 RepID=A0AAD5XIW5_9FUNG|nr:hypothetical protein HK100_010351 [Physocladia obscura]